MPKSLLGWAVLAIVVVWIAHNPAQAGTDVRHAVDSVFTFAANL